MDGQPDQLMNGIFHFTGRTPATLLSICKKKHSNRVFFLPDVSEKRRLSLKETAFCVKSCFPELFMFELNHVLDRYPERV